MSSYQDLRGQGAAAFALQTGRQRYWTELERSRAELVDPATGRARAELVQTVACATCGTDESKLAFHKGGFDYVRCRGCGTVYINPQLRPDVLAEFWGRSPAAEAWAAVLQHPAQLEYDRAKFGEVVARLGEPRGERRLLDFGCSTGVFLDAAREAGWHVHGVEPGHAPRRIATEQLGLDVVPRLDEVAGPFDVVTSWEVIEHTHEPLAHATSLRELSRPGGELVALIGGNAAALANRVMRAASAAFDFPRLWYFTPDSFSALLDRAGWDVVEVEQRLDEIDVVLTYLGYQDPYGERVFYEEILPADLVEGLRELTRSHGMGYKFLVRARARP